MEREEREQVILTSMILRLPFPSLPPSFDVVD